MDKRSFALVERFMTDGTGSKYCRMTGDTEHKDKYRPFAACGNRTESLLPKMKVLILAGESPSPGGNAWHAINRLFTHMAYAGVEVHVLAGRRAKGTQEPEAVRGLWVHHVDGPVPAEESDIVGRVILLNRAMVDYGMALMKEVAFDVIHVHGWSMAPAAVTLGRQYGKPLIAAMHATERERSAGIGAAMQAWIRSLEGALLREARRVAVCSRTIAEELVAGFAIAPQHIDLIPYGVDPASVRANRFNAAFRERYAQPHEKIVLFHDHLIRDKGVHILLEAAPLVLEAYPRAAFVIAGEGPALHDLKEQAHCSGLGNKVMFTGMLEDTVRNELFGLTSVAVSPSLYEPFGEAALMAMAAGVPVLVSDTGGLGELVQHGEDGMTSFPGDPKSLAQQLIRVLKDEYGARQMAGRALVKVKDGYSWDRAAYAAVSSCFKAAGRSELLQPASTEHAADEQDPAPI